MSELFDLELQDFNHAMQTGPDQIMNPPQTTPVPQIPMPYAQFSSDKSQRSQSNSSEDHIFTTIFITQSNIKL